MKNVKEIAVSINTNPILNEKAFKRAIEHLAETKTNEDKAFKSFSFVSSNAIAAMNLYKKSLAKANGETSFDCYTRNPAMLIESFEMIDEMTNLRLHKMAKNIFALQRELAKEKEDFKHLLNEKIEIGEAITEETVVAGKPYNNVIAVMLNDKDRDVLVQLALEVVVRAYETSLGSTAHNLTIQQMVNLFED